MFNEYLETKCCEVCGNNNLDTVLNIGKHPLCDDLVEIADACGDMLYILCGTLLKHGLQHKIEEVFKEIQSSNMSKLDVKGEPIYREDGKVLKSELYFKPDIQTILNN